MGYQCEWNGGWINGGFDDGRTESHGSMCILSPCAERRFRNNGREIDEISPFYSKKWIHMFIIILTWKEKMIEKKRQDYNAAKPMMIGFCTIGDESRVEINAY